MIKDFLSARGSYGSPGVIDILERESVCLHLGQLPSLDDLVFANVEGKPKVISEALGHFSVAFTMETYSHIIEGMQKDTLRLLDEVLLEGINIAGEE